MPKLFIRIFLSFWLLLALISIATFAAISERLDRRQASLREVAPIARIAEAVAKAQQAADRGGRAALETWLRNVNERQPLPFFLVDDDGRDLLGRELPEYMDVAPGRRVMLFHASASPLSARPPPMLLAGPPPPPVVRLADGTEYLMVPDFGGVTVERLLVANAPFVAIVLAGMVLLSGLVCFLLARHVTQPLTQLQDVIHQWGRGKLAIRTSEGIRARDDELAALARDLDEMAERLHVLIESQQQLVSDVSHELRSPLARLVMASALLRRKSGENCLPELDRIEHEAELLAANINRILFLARLEAENRLLLSVPVDVSALARESVENVAIMHPDGPRLAFQGDDAILVPGDPDLLRTAFENILFNAVKYSRDTDTIDIDVSRHASGTPGVKIRVRDSGPGIPDEMLTKVFERFVRVDPARQTFTGGLGLGLSITKRAISLHGGSVHAANRQPSGLEIVIFLPAAAGT